MNFRKKEKKTQRKLYDVPKYAKYIKKIRKEFICILYVRKIMSIQRGGDKFGEPHDAERHSQKEGRKSQFQ